MAQRTILPKKNKRSSKNENEQFVEAVLNFIDVESSKELAEINAAFEAMGWHQLPFELKIEIYDDVKFMVQELKGYYSSCDPFVKRRRDTVHYWVSCYQDGICSLETAIDAVKY